MVEKFNMDDVLKAADFTSAEKESVRKGELVKGVLDSQSDRELAVKFAFQLKNMDVPTIQESFMESAFKKISDPSVSEVGQLIEGDSADQAFASLKLEPNTEAALKLYCSAAPGDDLNLSAAEISAFHKLGKKATQAEIETCLRKQLLSRYQKYRELGLKGVEPYQRSRSKSYSSGDELQHKTELMKFVEKNMPELFEYIVQYPTVAKPEGVVESFSWTNSAIDDLPTIALVHKIGYRVGDIFVFFMRMFYVNRSHNSVQGVGGFFPSKDSSDDSIVVYGTRTSTDKVAGFGGAAKRTIGARIMSSKQAENFERLRAMQDKKGSK